MGIDYQAYIVIGYPYAEIKDKIESIIEETEFDDDAYEWIDDEGLVIIGPYYDCPIDESLIGITVSHTRSYAWQEINMHEITDSLSSKVEELVKLFGIAPKLYLSPRGY